MILLAIFYNGLVITTSSFLYYTIPNVFVKVLSTKLLNSYYKFYVKELYDLSYYFILSSNFYNSSFDKNIFIIYNIKYKYILLYNF